LVTPAGFEPATFSLEDKRIIRKRAVSARQRKPRYLDFFT
jgi:hypothetical protein